MGAKKIDFSDYKFRPHMVYKLKVGTIGLTEAQSRKRKALRYEKKNGVNFNGNKVKWTFAKKEELKELNRIDRERELPKTIKSELRKIHRAEKHNRNFSSTNKYVEKGILEEEEAITTYQKWLILQGRKTHFVKNDKRLQNGYYDGEPDLTDSNDVFKCKEGFDTKCSWELDTFPFPKDKLDEIYECQNQGYMDLTGARKWTTVYVLVNCSQDLLWKEKMKYFYAYGQPDQEDDPKRYALYLQKAKETEARLVFDRERFEYLYPGYDFDISREEWDEKELDIPLEDRVVEFVSYYDGKLQKELKQKIRYARKYLNSL